MEGVVDVLLSKDQGLVDDRQREHNKKIKRDYEVLSHLVDDSLLQRLTGITHGTFS
jgi:hypothetical protein